MSRSSSTSGEKPVDAENLNSDEAPLSDKADKAEKINYPSPRNRIVIMFAVYLASFLVTLDQNIIATAIPRITDEFNSLGDVGWYGSAYLLTMSGLQLLMGKVYKHYPVKPVFLTGCLLFEIGSAICGSAPNSIAFIFGRAIQGLGCAGLYSGLMVIMLYTVPLQQRPIFQGFFGVIFAVASAVGPLIGGTFTDKVTWRWCFYINLPIGGVSMVVTFFLLHVPDQKLTPPAEGLLGKIKQLDPVGNLVFFPGVLCLILALQWGGTEYKWSNFRIILLLVLFFVLFSAFIAIQIWLGENAAVPPRVVKQRSIAACIWFGFFMGACTMVLIYYIPIWFQAIKGSSAINSGIQMLPLILAVVVGGIGSGIIISRLGYYTPFFLLSSLLSPIGAGLMSTFKPMTGHSEWIGYQVLMGFAMGIGSQQPFNVVHTVLDSQDVSTGTAVLMFARFLGASIFVPVAQNIFLNGLVSKLTNIPGINLAAITGGGATELRDLVSEKDLPTLLLDYNDALVNVFHLVTATSAATMLGSIFVEWRSLRARANEQKGRPKDLANEQEDKPKESQKELEE